VDELDIAIVGMAGRFPGARNIEEFWRNLRAGVDAVRFLTADDLARGGVDPSVVRDPSYVPASMMLDDADMFDAGFFGYTPREAQTLDPQGRVFLECVWEALEHAGCDPHTYPGAIGVFACQSTSTYLLGNLHGQIAFREFILSTTNLQSVIAAGHDFLPTRVSYKLNLTGPSVNVQSACSSSLVAVHLARQSLLTGECDAAVVGGVSIYLPQEAGYHYQEGMILSPDGRCRPFDAEANGTIFGRGAGVIVLKPIATALRDGDEIYAVIKGSAVNNDGAAKVGYTAPGVDGQARVVAEALANAGVDADSIGYIEAHGTGTAQGDPIEIAALTRAFRAATSRTQFCAIGSVKGNVGHLDVAAGVTGLIKTVLMLRNRERLPSLHFTRPNPLIDFASSPFYVNATLSPWDAASGPRRAGVSSFGMGGTNAHVVLEEAPAVAVRTVAPVSGAHLLTLSAKTPKALTESAARYETWLRDNPAADLAAMCDTTNVGRAHFTHRIGIVVRSRDQAIEALRAFGAGKTAPLVATGVASRTVPHVAFLFTGQGSQYSGMGRALYQSEPVFKTALDRCAAMCGELEIPLLSVMFDPQYASTLDQTRYTQPALFALEYALVELWRSWGVEPSLVLGHSLGEDIAACVAGVFSLEDGMRLIVARARLMQALPPTGEMVTLFGPEVRIRDAVNRHAGAISIAALNGPDIVLVSGERAAVRSIVAELAREGIKARPLTASHAFHSALMDPMLDTFESIARGVSYSPPSIPLLSNVTADVATPDLVCDPVYWRRHVRETVRFAEAVTHLRTRRIPVVIEIGPTPSLLALAQRTIGDEGIAWLPSLRNGRVDGEQMKESLAALYTAGLEINWPGVHGGRRSRRIALPSYPFQRERFWIERNVESSRPRSVRHSDRLVGHRITSPVLQDLVYETSVSVDAVPYVSDHVVGNAVLFPATGFLELAFEAGSSLGPVACLENVSIGHALVVPAAGARVQTIIAPARDGRSTFKVFGRIDTESEDSSWTLHAQGEVVAVPAPPAADVNAGDLVESAQSRSDHHASGSEYYQRLAAEGFAYGPTFRRITEIWWRAGEAVARVREPEEVSIGQYRAHPAVLDGGLQLVLAAVGQLESAAAHLYLPVSIGRVDVSDSFTGFAWSHVEARADGAAGYLATFTMLDDSGRIVARFADMRLVRTPRSTLPWQSEATDERLYQVLWEPSILPAVQTLDRAQHLDRPAVPDCVVFGDESGLAGALQREWAGVCRLIVPGRTFAVRPDGVVTVDPSSAADFRAALDELCSDGSSCRTVVHCVAADRTTDPSSLDDLRTRQTQAVGSLLALTQALIGRSTGAPSLWIVTRGTPVTNTGVTAVASEATVWGMARSIALEHPELSCTRIDLDPLESMEAAASRLGAELRAPDGEDQIAWRGDARYVARLVPASLAAAAPVDTDRQLQILSRGVLDRLEIRPAVRRQPGPRQVEIRVRAAGLNFKDVLNALGAYPGDPGPLGFECAGVVTAIGSGVSSVRVGDEVLAIAPGCLGTRALAHESLVVRKPARLSMEQAATLPGVFLTAWHSLIDIAHLRAGDRVLIHAAAGGVGLAALQLAVRAGAEVFATAGSKEKRQLVRERGAAHVMDSRSLDFADEIRTLTRGRGVDVVLNSLAGEFIDRSVDVTAQGGRFVELGKTGSWNESRVAALGRGIDYREIDIQARAERDPDRLGALLHTIVAEVEAGVLQPLPVQSFRFDESATAFRFMSQARHVGKIALVMPRVADAPPIVRTEATYLITGGFGGLGLLLAEWMVNQGATHIVLFGRRPPHGARAEAVDALRKRGADIHALIGDVSSTDDVRHALDTIRRTMPPLRGVLHAAGTLDDGAIVQQKWERFDRVLAAKVDGAWNLDQLTRDLELDWFVLFSSLASMLGSPGQANHAAGNAFLDALAEVRRRRGAPALSINWGAWAEVGVAAERELIDRLSGMGVGAMSPAEGIALFDTVMRASLSGRLSSSQVGVLPMMWDTYVKRVCAGRVPRFLSVVAQRARREGRSVEARATSAAPPERTLIDRLRSARPTERRELLIAYVREHVVRSLGLDGAQLVDVRRPLGELGIDSLMAIELRSRIASGLGVSRSLPATLLFDYPSVEQIAGYLQRALLPEDAVEASATADNSRAATLAAVADLTDQEAEALLLAELTGKRSVN
jgi:acyl transferase domain-containing protein